LWRRNDHRLVWDRPFVLPGWMNAWWRHFGPGYGLTLCGFWKGERLIGIAPLRRRGSTAAIVGGADVCDYLDLVAAPDTAFEFFRGVFAALGRSGVSLVDFENLRPDSTVLSYAPAVAADMGLDAVCTPQGVSFEMTLPETWDAYLGGLTGKQRHEVRRKLRRVREAGRIDFRVVDRLADDGDAVGTFLGLFRSNRPDKQRFMSAAMADYFRRLADEMDRIKALRLCFLDIDHQPVAAVMCVDYGGVAYLYNNGYDDRFRSLSVGLISKVLSIRDSIERGLTHFDFLKGTEAYKRQLGGIRVPLHRLRIALSG
jgi:CelD/BcsL family acetyltransferase involved in cellulose biosynthesis